MIDSRWISALSTIWVLLSISASVFAQGDICGVAGIGNKGTDSGTIVDSTFHFAFRRVLLTTGAIPPSEINNFNYNIVETSTDQYSITYIYGGVQVIEYNIDSMRNLRKRLRNPFTVYVIAGHEIAHNLHQHFARGLAVTTRELAADRSMAYYLKNMESAVTVDQILAPIRAISSDESVDGYPAWREREAAIRDGYKQAMQPLQASVLFSIEYHALNYVPDKQLSVSWQKSAREYANASRFSEVAGQDLGDVKINNIPDASFLIKDDKLFYRLRDNRVIEIGDRVPSPIPKYRFMIVDKFYRNWFVSEDGSIYNRAELYIGNVTLN